MTKIDVVLVMLFLSAKLNVTWCKCSDDTVTVANKSDYPYKTFVYDGNLNDCECDANVCIRKCCAESYVLINKTCVYNNDAIFFKLYDKEEPIDDASLRKKFITGITQCYGHHYILDPSVDPNDVMYLQKDGRLWVPDYADYIPLNEHCLESNGKHFQALVCITHTNDQSAKTLNIAGMIISTPFLLATFVVYAVLPDKNIHGKSLMCYVFSLLLSYVLLCIINTIHMQGVICVATGLSCMYFFTASFLWMNAMSIDIWLTFSGSRNFSGNRRASARKQFLRYNLYAWGSPLLLILIVANINSFSDPKSWYNPNIGVISCWIKGSLAELVYFYAPLALIIVVNLVLFAVTALKIRKLQQDTAVLRTAQFKKHSEEDEKRFKLYIKLSLAMGVNWIMEIVSWAVDWQAGSVPETVWYLTDFCNAAYGVIIFFIFTCKKKIWTTLKNQYNCCRRNATPKGSPCHTSETAM